MKGKCEHECLSMQNSCQRLLDDEIDRDDLSALLWKGTKTTPELENVVCKTWTNRCNKKPGKISNRVDYEFTVISERDAQIQELLATMEEQGMGGMNMMDRDSMLDQLDGDEYGDMYGDMFGGMDNMGMGMGGDMLNDMYGEYGEL